MSTKYYEHWFHNLSDHTKILNQHLRNYEHWSQNLSSGTKFKNNLRNMITRTKLFESNL